MAASSEPDEPTTLSSVLHERARTRRSVPELIAENVFRPLASPVVQALLPLRVSPSAVVLANATAGLGSVVLITQGQLIGAALLLQLKTVLDNADGQLARASGRTSALGRYLDTEADLVVNVALFAALAYAADAPVLALAAFVALTVVLSADFNEDVLYRRARGETVVTEPSAAGEGRLARLLAGVYRVLFGPQDRAFQAISSARLGRLLDGVSDPDHRGAATLAYHDGFTSAVLANLGLSTQLAVLGVCLALGAPEAYLWIVLGCAALLPPLELRRDLQVRRVLAY
jgi:archaetidylinositol phosphate synthase